MTTYIGIVFTNLGIEIIVSRLKARERWERGLGYTRSNYLLKRERDERHLDGSVS